jgi:arylsulfatase A-like enzyme
LVLAVACSGKEPARKRPNVVLVLIDTLRPDHLELYGYPKATAPWLAALGARGTVFEHAYSSSAWTPPATASVFTGLYPTGHGLVHGFETDAWIRKQVELGHKVEIEVARLPEDHATLPERMRAGGYRTVGYATNPHITGFFGFDRGFERFVAKSDQDIALVSKHLVARRDELEVGERPYFLYLHLNDVHKPYEERAPWYVAAEDERQDEIARYDSGISYVDQALRHLAETLGWDEDTVVCVVSDHGEAFLEHGFYGHASSIHSELNRVLMLFSGPGIDTGRIATNASLVDVAPTLLELAGLPAVDGDGLSLVPLLRAEEREQATARLEDRILFAHRRGMSENALESANELGDLWSVQRRGLRLIQDEVSGLQGLYDLRADPLEQENLFDGGGAARDELLVLLEKFRERGIRPADGKSSVLLDAELLGELRAMGYVGKE